MTKGIIFQYYVNVKGKSLINHYTVIGVLLFFFHKTVERCCYNDCTFTYSWIYFEWKQIFQVLPYPVRVALMNDWLTSSSHDSKSREFNLRITSKIPSLENPQIRDSFHQLIKEISLILKTHWKLLVRQTKVLGLLYSEWRVCKCASMWCIF